MDPAQEKAKTNRSKVLAALATLGGQAGVKQVAPEARIERNRVVTMLVALAKKQDVECVSGKGVNGVWRLAPQ